MFSIANDIGGVVAVVAAAAIGFVVILASLSYL